MDGGIVASTATESPPSRSDRLPLLAFIGDLASETVLCEGLSEAMPGGFEVRRGNVRTAC